MNTLNLKSIAFLGSALLIPAYADKVQLQQLPANVQQNIRSRVGTTAEINDIDRDTRNGQTTYQVGFKNNGGPQNEVTFDQNGNVPNSGSTTTAPPLDNRKLTRGELPVPVRHVVNSQLRGMEINDIERNVKNGQATYGIGYKQAGGVGPQQELVLSDTGAIISSSAGLTNPAPTPYTAVNQTVPTSTPSVASTVNNKNNYSRRSINYQDVPQSVKTVASQHLNHGAVKQTERQIRNGEVDYQIEFLKENGQYQEMLISEDGRVLENQLLQANGLGAPATVQSDAATSTVKTNSGRLLNRLGQAVFNGQ